MMRPWAIYGAYEPGPVLLYVGRTTDIKARTRQHRQDKAWGDEVYLRVIRRAESKSEAARIEAEIIRRRRPPKNFLHNPDRGTYDIMPADDARKIWHGSPTTVDRCLVARMHGWTVGRARSAFGPRHREICEYDRVGLGRKVLHFTAEELRDAKAVWRNVKDYPTWEDAASAFPKGFTTARAHRLWGKRH